MALLKNGQPAPEFTLESVDGGQISLHDLKGSGNNTLLIFLRHLG